jgi:hypothetical protein
MSAYGAMEYTGYYLQKKADNILLLRYDDIVSNPEAAIEKIANFPQLRVTDSTVRQIATALSRNK